MTHSSPSYSVPFDLDALSDKPVEIKLVPDEPDRAAIAKWLDIVGLERLEATVRLSRKTADFYSYDAHFHADVVQACVVTLEPVRSHLSGEFVRAFQIKPKALKKRRPRAGEPEPAPLDLSGSDDDDPEWRASPVIDLAAPVLEELSLALDPYPRAPGAAFEVQEEQKPVAENPFAVLEKLKAGQASRPGEKAPKDRGKPKP